jgi:putative redox protein
MHYIVSKPKLDAAGRKVQVAETGAGTFQQSVAVGPHHLVADEPVAVGGRDTGPSPYDLLLAALGACTTMTLRLYARRKALPLEHVAVELRHSRVHAADNEAVCEGKPCALEQVERVITLEGTLTPEQRRRLLEIADKCPVHRTLENRLRIVTSERK